MSKDKDEIILRGLKENNLKNIDLTLPKRNITVFTGLSGSGKSSVAFDTLATESRRQMTMNYPLYVRNQMPRYERPHADLMHNLSPVVVVEQRAVSANSRSSVSTYMDIDPLIRLLFSRIGKPSIGSATDYTRQSAFGRCPKCDGFGEVVTADVDKLVDFDKSLREYAVQFKPLSPAGWQGNWMMTCGLFDPDKPIKDYTEETRELFLYGPPGGGTVYAPFHTKDGPHNAQWDGLLPRFTRLYINRDVSKLKQVSQDDVLNVSSHSTCPLCHGNGLNPKVLESKINGFNLLEYRDLELTDIASELDAIDDPLGESIAQQALPLVTQLIDMGLGYLSLSRTMKSLSGGESQRVKIARHLASSLNNMTYVFDEPSAGLHPEEVSLLIEMLNNIKTQHNTVIVIEHNLSIIKAADEIVEMGPGAGVHGGEVVYQGSPEGLNDAKEASTRLNHALAINENPRTASDYFIIKEAKTNNLKNVSVKIPQNQLTTIAGVSGSGKSSLMLEAFRERYPETITVSQRPLGLSSRSTLATYMGIMDDIRKTFAKETGQPAGLFSFNSLGACPVCKGKGVIQPDAAFADPITIRCETCGGTRYSEEARSYTYRGKNIVEMLDLTVNEALAYFEQDKIIKKVAALKDVGLGYLTLGQTTSSLSGGEVQRLKLASELKKEGQIYLLDEPSLGLHLKDNEKLLAVFDKLVERGNTVIVIEHNLEFIAASDWLIELGPEGGKRGGHIIFEGTPKEMLQSDTVTAKWLSRAVTNEI
ncbi:MAG: ATP-binding cassette domain-containing protein [Alkalibacterium sp.]|uniref:ATP-binding cassette domain-containing protein n=1 Tax=Alkalibacterium sp. TaxID=1872447 RepID=UPI0026483BBF|nr:ATP-binding cassette domain-containing protein [Alkalibacterium sp.]MDN6293383.1 ATP-binding cassette domain-containing protein [Alkalibacterium sp.]MDN6295330.1 ATP-binding cassette domain-containing protein [Alkalibacterium sp.]